VRSRATHNNSTTITSNTGTREGRSSASICCSLPTSSMGSGCAGEGGGGEGGAGEGGGEEGGREGGWDRGWDGGEEKRLSLQRPLY
jgi:hypothetical protein